MFTQVGVTFSFHPNDLALMCLLSVAFFLDYRLSLRGNLCQLPDRTVAGQAYFSGET